MSVPAVPARTGEWPLADDASRAGESLLDGTPVDRWLVRNGLASAADVAQVTLLEGGVSGVVLAVTIGTRQVVVKQALPRLSVKADWRCDPRRLVHEGRAAEVFARLTPEHVPTVLALDEQTPALAMARAPESWRDWRRELLDMAMRVEPVPGLGTLLARWHSDSRRLGGLENVVGPGTKYFRELRLDPFLDASAPHLPDLAADLSGCRALLERRPQTLVHGDFSPKNVLRGPDGFWVIDFEVAHLGQPVFDIAFLLAHLALKRVYRPDQADELAEVASQFCEEYWAGVDADLRPGHQELALVLGSLILARIFGMSRVSYLDDSGRREAERQARRLLAEAAAPHVQLTGNPWRRLEGLLT